MIIDENKDYCFIKSKLVITVKILRKYNDRSRVVAKQTNKQTNKQTKQTQKHRNWQTLLSRKTYLSTKKKYLKNKRISRRTVNTRTKRGK